MSGLGVITLNRDLPDDFGDAYVPFTIRCTDNYGNLWVWWHFDRINFDARYHYFHSQHDIT